MPLCLKIPQTIHTWYQASKQNGCLIFASHLLPLFHVTDAIWVVAKAIHQREKEVVLVVCVPAQAYVGGILNHWTICKQYFMFLSNSLFIMAYHSKEWHEWIVWWHMVLSIIFTSRENRKQIPVTISSATEIDFFIQLLDWFFKRAVGI